MTPSKTYPCTENRIKIKNDTMIFEKQNVEVDNGIEFITDWKDTNGNYKFDQYLSQRRLIVNKSVTGCGFTTYSLCNNEHTILISPRLWLINNKLDEFNRHEEVIFYFDREKKIRDGKEREAMTVEELQQGLFRYCEKCRQEGKPMKILVTYDSFSNLVDMLEEFLWLDVNSMFRIAIDEAHTIIKDVKLKEYNNKCVLSSFLQRLFQYEKLLFISATPIIEYLKEVPEFQEYDVDYIELQWSNVEPIIIKPNSCKNATDAFDKIYARYMSHVDDYGRHCFDDMYLGGRKAYYSYEAVIFLNSVLDIRRIIEKYVNREHLIDIADISVMCAKTKENYDNLHKTHKGLTIMKSIPQEGERHTTWTFVTRTAFEGVDFKSTCASSFVIANYNVACMSIDIASDIPQIIGRQRLKSNVFRHILNIYYTNNLHEVNDIDFYAYQQNKLKESNDQILLWEDANPQRKEMALENLGIIVDNDPNRYYIKTVNGIPEINKLLIISEQYCRDVLKNQQKWYIVSTPGARKHEYSPCVSEILSNLGKPYSGKSAQSRIKIALDGFYSYPEYSDEIFEMLCKEGFNDIAYYFHWLSLDRIIANGADPWKMQKEIELARSTNDIRTVVASKFESGQRYSKKETKAMLQEVFDIMGIKKTAKASDLPVYIDCKLAKKDGLKAWMVT